MRCLNMETKKIDIEKIILEIREEIRTKGYIEEKLDFDRIPIKRAVSASLLDVKEFNMEELLQSVAEINQYYYIEPYKELKSTRPMIGPIIVFIKKIIRKLIKFYIEPVVFEQRNYNASVVCCINQMVKYIDEQQYNLELKYENEKLKRELATEQKMYGVLCFENELLKQEISALKEGRV